MNASVDKDQAYQQALSSTLKFTAEDLEANRKGSITESQKSKIMWRPGMIGCFGVLLLVGAFLLLSGLTALVASGEPGALIGVVAGAALAGIGLLVARSWYGAVREGRVETYEGLVLRDEEKRNIQGGSLIGDLIAGIAAAVMGVDKIHYFKCDAIRLRLRVPRAAHGVLNEYRLHRVFYNPKSKRVLSAEVLPEAADTKKAVPTFREFTT